VLAQRYRLESQIATGGMSAVWSARDLSLDVPVAVKFMSAEVASQPGLSARFEREAKAAARLRSPHVAQTMDYGVGETPYIVMELLEGEDLSQRIKRERVFPLSEVVRIGVEVCRGLARAHQAGIVHRDLKPGNIFLSAPDNGLVKILDFGIAKATGISTHGGEVTTTGQLLGSPAYMSPEQSRGGEVDARSDLWSLAVILYRLITGRRLFNGTDVGDIIVRISTDPIPPPSSVREGLPASIDRFFERALSRDKAERYPDAKTFADCLVQASGRAAATPFARSPDPELGATAVGEPSGSISSGVAAASVPTAGTHLTKEPTPTPFGSSATQASAEQFAARAKRNRPKRTKFLFYAASTGVGILLAVIVASFGPKGLGTGPESPPDALGPAPAVAPAAPTLGPATPELAPATTREKSAMPEASSSPGASASAKPSATPDASLDDSEVQRKPVSSPRYRRKRAPPPPTKKSTAGQEILGY